MLFGSKTLPKKGTNAPSKYCTYRYRCLPVKLRNKLQGFGNKLNVCYNNLPEGENVVREKLYRSLAILIRKFYLFLR
jgi:hypothetical protein